MAWPGTGGTRLEWVMSAATGLWMRQAAGVLIIVQAGCLAVALGALAGPDRDRAVIFALCFFGVAAFRAGLSAWGEGLATRAGLAEIARRREGLLGHIARPGPAVGGPAALETGAVAVLGADKLEALLPDLVHYKNARIAMMITPLAILGAVAWVSWVAALILLIAAPLIPLFMALVGMAARETSEKHLQDVGAMHALFLDRLRALSDIRLLGAVPVAARQFDAAARTVHDQAMRVLRIAFLTSAVLELFAALGVALVAVYVGFSLLGLLSFGTSQGPLTLTTGLFVLILAPEFFAPLRAFSAAWHDHANATAVEAELDALAQTSSPQMIGTGGRAARLAGPASIRLAGVVCRGIVYPPDLDIAPGQSVALMGPSGSGKSTLLGLMAGLLKPDAGGIEVAGQPLDEACADGWRARIAWLSQSPHFVAGSIRANVALGGQPDDKAAIDRALQAAAAGPVVDRAPRGADTAIGETGFGLSGGEARRLALARALYQRGDLVLADEPTAHLDAETARAVGDGLVQCAAGGATVIVATHDEALARRFDRIVRLGA